jgi:hypothetical protein
MRTIDVELMEAETNRLAAINSNQHFFEMPLLRNGLHYRFATVHAIFTLFSLGRAAEAGWILPAILAVVSCLEYCRSLAHLPDHVAHPGLSWQLAATTGTVIVAATMAIVMAFTH